MGEEKRDREDLWKVGVESTNRNECGDLWEKERREGGLIPKQNKLQVPSIPGIFGAPYYGITVFTRCGISSGKANAGLSFLRPGCEGCLLGWEMFGW